jgi:NADH-quinone oxidoreductase subunit L
MFFAVCLGLFLPLFGFLLLVAFSQRIGRQTTHAIACGTVLISFFSFIACFFFYQIMGKIPQDFLFYPWLVVDAVQANFTLHVDSLSLLMTFIITGVGFLIHVYSTGYMDHEKDYARYFAFLNLFIFFMLLLVLAGDLLLLFVGWEGVGLASYLLIGFWYERPAAAQAATKAFVINRIGDLGLLLGILLTFYLFGTTEITTVSQLAKQQFAVGAPVITLLTLLYFVGATGKSAQLPLYTWLPDAMEGPTPVSALIHAATMVTAGVYLVVRMNEVFLLAPFTLQVVGIIGAVTALFASICALAQTDLKRVLAYSTVSQLGLMFLACGSGAFYSGMFHLTTHAFVKALLFLSAGNVVHLLHGTTEMSKMGGLSKVFTKTHVLFLIGVLALAGIPPLATFFSKDLILEQAHMAGFNLLFYLGLAASILTGFYLTRAYCLTFRGASHLTTEELQTVHEAPARMLIPVSILGLLAVIGGLLGFTFNEHPLLEKFLYPIIQPTVAEQQLSSGFILTPETWLAIAGAIFGVGSAAWLYTQGLNRLGPTVEWVKKAFYLNEIYWACIALPLQGLAWFIASVSEPKIFDQSIEKINQLTEKIAQGLQRVQSGQIRSYVAWMVLGSVALLAFLAF